MRGRPSGRLPVARVTEIFRQTAESRIITAAHSINRGALPDLAPPADASDFYFVEVADGEDAAAKIVKVVAERIPARFGLNAIRDVQVLCPMNRGSAGARALNSALQEALNPAKPGQPSVDRFGTTFRVGDKVMQTENNYDRDVFNGDLGFIAAIDMEEAELMIDFDGRSVVYPFGELDEVSPAFATTIHKSQGSEYPAVVVPVLTQHYTMLARNLIYTGITRGKRLVVIVGQKKAIGMAVRNARGRRRRARDEPRSVSGISGRFVRAHRNLLEIFPQFASALFVVHAAGVAGYWFATGAWIFFAARCFMSRHMFLA